MGLNEGDREARERARALLAAGRGDDALALATRALRSAPSDAGWLVLAGRARALTGDSIAAESMLLKAVRAAPTDAEPLLRLGEVLISRGDPARAVKALERGASLAPDDASITALLEQARASVGKPRPPKPQPPAAHPKADADEPRAIESSGSKPAETPEGDDPEEPSLSAPVQRDASADDPDVSAETSAAADEPEPSLSAPVERDASVDDPDVSAETSTGADDPDVSAETSTGADDPDVSAEMSTAADEPERRPSDEPELSAETSSSSDEPERRAVDGPVVSAAADEPERRSLDEPELSAETSTAADEAEDPLDEPQGVPEISEIACEPAEDLPGESMNASPAIDVPEPVAETAADEVEPSFPGRSAISDERDVDVLPAGVVDEPSLAAPVDVIADVGGPEAAAATFDVVDEPAEPLDEPLEERESQSAPADPSLTPRSASEDVDVVAMSAPLPPPAAPPLAPTKEPRPLLSPFVAIRTPAPPRDTKNTLSGVPAAPLVPRPTQVSPPAPVIADTPAPDRSRHERGLPSRLRDGSGKGPPLAPPASGRGTEQIARTHVLSGPAPVTSDARSADTVASPTAPVLPKPSAPRVESPGGSEEEHEPPTLAAPALRMSTARRAASGPAIAGEAEPAAAAPLPPTSDARRAASGPVIDEASVPVPPPSDARRVVSEPAIDGPVAVVPVPPPSDARRVVSEPAIDDAPVAVAPVPPPSGAPEVVSGPAIDAPVAVAPVPPRSDARRFVSGSTNEEAPVAFAPVPPSSDAPEVVSEPAVDEAPVAVAPVVSTLGMEPVAAPAPEEPPPVPVAEVEPAFQPAAMEPQQAERDPQLTFDAPTPSAPALGADAEPRRGCRAIVLAAFGLVVFAGVAVGGYVWSTSYGAAPIPPAASAPAPPGPAERDPSPAEPTLAGGRTSAADPTLVATRGAVGAGQAPSATEPTLAAGQTPSAADPTLASTHGDVAAAQSAAEPTLAPASGVRAARAPADGATPAAIREEEIEPTAPRQVLAQSNAATEPATAQRAADAVAWASERDVEASLTRVAGLVRARHPELALRALERVERAGVPARLQMRAAYLRGRAELMADRYADAARTLERVVADPDAPARAFFFLGEAASRRNTPVASAAYQRYLELEPDGRFAERARRALTPSDR